MVRSIVMQVTGPCKTESSQKPVPLDPYLAEALRAWLEHLGYNRPEDWVFANPRMKGRQPYWGNHAPGIEIGRTSDTSSAEKVDGLGGSIGAIEGRHAKSNKPANMKQAVTSIAIEMRRIIVIFLPSAPEFLGLFILVTHFYRSEVVTNSERELSFRRRTFRRHSVFFLNRNCRPEKSWNDGRPIPTW
jgi:hypothetical protein